MSSAGRELLMVQACGEADLVTELVVLPNRAMAGDCASRTLGYRFATRATSAMPMLWVGGVSLGLLPEPKAVGGG
jgi:hypothetical protein